MAGVLLEPGAFNGHLEVGEEAAKLKRSPKKHCELLCRLVESRCLVIKP